MRLVRAIKAYGCPQGPDISKGNLSELFFLSLLEKRLPDPSNCFPKTWLLCLLPRSCYRSSAETLGWLRGEPWGRHVRTELLGRSSCWAQSSAGSLGRDDSKKWIKSRKLLWEAATPQSC